MDVATVVRQLGQYLHQVYASPTTHAIAFIATRKVAEIADNKRALHEVLKYRLFEEKRASGQLKRQLAALREDRVGGPTDAGTLAINTLKKHGVVPEITHQAKLYGLQKQLISIHCQSCVYPRNR